MLAIRPDQHHDDQSDHPDLRGDFEVHLTVEPGAAEALAGWADGHGLKFTHILLARGAAPSQPMLTLRANGSLDEVTAATSRTTGRLVRAGFTVLRTKIEATPWAEGVPVSDEDAVPHGERRYFEHHVKLLLPDPLPTADLAELAVRHGAHLSHNPRRIRDDGRREWFVTQRCRLVGLSTAGHRLDALLLSLAADGREVVSVEREFVAVDSAEALDEGWISEHEHEQNHEREQKHEQEQEGDPR